MKLKDKLGNELTIKEFFGKWKEGIDNITPIQKLENEFRGNAVNLFGLMVALIAVIFSMDKIGLLSYGLILIFIGSIWSSGVKVLALRQQLKFMRGFEEQINNPIIDEVKKEEVKSGI